MEIFDCHVRTVFEDEGQKLAEWRAARRVQLRGAASRQQVGADVGEMMIEPLHLVAAA